MKTANVKVPSLLRRRLYGNGNGKGGTGMVLRTPYNQSATFDIKLTDS